MEGLNWQNEQLLGLQVLGVEHEGELRAVVDVHPWLGDAEQGVGLLHRQQGRVLVLQNVAGVNIPGDDN